MPACVRLSQNLKIIPFQFLRILHVEHEDIVEFLLVQFVNISEQVRSHVDRYDGKAKFQTKAFIVGFAKTT